MTDTLDLGSLSQQVAARAKARAQKRQTILTIPVPGFEDLFVVQYRRLTFDEKVEIAGRHDGVLLEGRATVEASADMLINACQDVLQVTGVDAYQSLGTRWTSLLIGQLFQLPQPPENVRDALILALDHEDLVAHFNAYMVAANDLDRSDTEALPGES